MIELLGKINSMLPFKLSTTFFLLICLALVYIIIKIPYIGKYLRVYYTLIHETGHAFMALITSGNVLNIELFSDTSGTAVTQSKYKFAAFLVSFAGYPFAAAFALFSLYLMQHNLIKLLLLVNLCIFILTLVFSIRNSYGLFWIISAICLLFFIYFRNNSMEFLIVELILGFILIVESIDSIITLLVIAYKNNNAAGDATNLKKATGIPSLFWAVVFMIITLYINYLIFKIFL